MSVTAFWTTLLIIHGLFALALLGAITHQAVAVLAPVRAAAGGFVARFRAVPAAGYATAIVVMYVNTSAEVKEHVAAMGLALLPAYWYFWRKPLSDEYASTRKWLTVVLAAMVWYCFLVGHVVNNVRGFGI